ncbi:tetratricopeptide repeat protein [Planctomycetota bacterium]
MKDESSIYDAEPEDLDRLVFEILGESEAEEDSGLAATLDGVLEQVGGRIGRYKLLSVLGEGGMGIVYLAEQQEPIRRKVALKVIKPGMDSKRVMARFEAERQALALLDHPNIAHVYDAGTTEAGRPFFVMEYVKGLSITEHCDHHKLTIEERLRLFQQVCQAVQHAHQKGIIHRDIKPSNILVCMEGDRAVPKIIDFGVAKALAQPLTERTLATEDSQLLGTPEYMSPEQADMATEDIDTRSDIYSLGVLLYVLLTGVLPFDSDTLRTGGIEHIRQIIRETDPKTPSTRLAKLGDEARKLAENRRTKIHTLARYLKKELEWIPLKAMRKDRAERYRSASELADDIENYLNGEPLIAGPSGTVYKLKKFVRRNRLLVGSIAALLVVLIAGVVVSSVFAVGQARALAENQLISDFLENDVLSSADKARVGEATVSYILDAASAKLEDKFKDKPLIQARLRRTLAERYRNLGEYEKARQHLLRASEIYRQYHGEEHPDALEAMSAIGWIYIKQGRFHDMERLWSQILPIEQRISGLEQQLATMNGLAVAYYGLGKYKEAESLFTSALELIRDEPDKEDFFHLPYIKSNLANVYRAQGRYEEAERLCVQTPAMGIMAAIYQAQGRYAEAEPLLVKALEEVRQLRGDEHYGTLEFSVNLAQLYVDQDRYEEAQELLNKALTIARKLLRKEHPVTLGLVNAYAVVLTNQEQYDQAEELFREALDGRQRELGDDHPKTLETINDLGILHRQWQHYKKAEELLKKALEGRKIKSGDDHPETLETLNDFGVLRREQGEYDEAANLLNEALEGRKTKLGPNHPDTLGTIHELAVLYKDQGQYEKAEPLLLEAIKGRRLKLGDTHPHTLESLNNLIDLYEAWNKPEKANEWRERLTQIEDFKK